MQTDPRLARDYYLKEGLRVIFKMPLAEAIEALDKWVGWTRRCRIPSFVKLQRSIVKPAILASIEHGLSNGRVQITMNTKIRLMTRIAFGFTSPPDALIALAMLSLGGHKPVFPGPHLTDGYVRGVPYKFESHRFRALRPSRRLEILDAYRLLATILDRGEVSMEGSPRLCRYVSDRDSASRRLCLLVTSTYLLIRSAQEAVFGYETRQK